LSAPASPGVFSAGFIRIVWPLAMAETLFWAATFYVFHPLLPRFEAHFGWHKTEITGAFTLALLSSAFFAPLVGGAIDRGFGRLAMGIGGITASASLLALSFVDTLWQFYLLWFVIGVCHSAILYEPCFAILTKLFAHDARRAITVVTLVAGLAGSIAFPLAYLLSERIGWQRSLWVFALIAVIATAIAVSCLPAAPKKVASATAPPDNDTADSSLERAVRSGIFWCLALAFSMMALNHGALLPHLLPLLAERGITAAHAVFAAALIGPMQVVGRILMIMIQRRASTPMITLLSFLMIAMASIALLFAGSEFHLVLLFVVLQGAGYGVTSITRPALTAEYLGRKGFGKISGAIAVPFITAFALGPTFGSWVWGNYGYDMLIVLTAVSAAVGALALVFAVQLTQRSTHWS